MRQKGIKPTEIASKAMIVLAAKVIVVLFIIVAPFMDMSSLTAFNTLAAKTICILIIVATCFFDFTLALLLTVAFLIALINLNARTIRSLHSRSLHRDTFIQQAVDREDAYAHQFVQETLPHVQDVTKNSVCSSTPTNDINQDLAQLYIDDKIKPYDVYIKMLTSDEQRDKAQGAFI